VPSLAFVAGPSRIDANAAYRHAPNDLQHGSFRVHVASNQVQLAQFQSLVKTRPGLRGVLTLNADATGQVAADVQLTALNANAGIRGLEMEGKRLGDRGHCFHGGRPSVQVNSPFAPTIRRRPLSCSRRHAAAVRRSPSCPSTVPL
jgi:hypothetical protein